MSLLRVFLAVLVLGGGVGPVVATTGPGGTVAATSTTAQADQTLDRTLYLELTPDNPGSIRVHARFDIPQGVTQLTALVQKEATVTDTNGFRRRSETRYEWQQTENHPTITWTLPVNRTTTSGRTGATASSGFTFVDTGDWALVATPQLPIRYSGFGNPPEVTKEVVVNGTGVPGTAISYLGPYREQQRTAAGQTIRLVVPAAADVAAGPRPVLDSITTAASHLDIGGRDEEVVAFAAPTTVEWGPPGLQRGPDEFWVRDDELVNKSGNIWLHEYLHTRQAADTTNSSRWLVEGSAEYYANYLSLRQERIGFQQYRDHLAFGTREAYRDAVLAERDDWEGTGANYWKGSLVVGAIDRQIRLATDREKTFADVYRRLNDQQNFTNREFLDAVGAVAGPEVRRYARRYTTTTAAPELWDYHAHRVAFRSAANVSTEMTGLQVRGPYRNTRVEAPVTVVPGERVRTTVQVTNVGAVAGTYTVFLRKDGQRVASSTGRLAEDASTSVELAAEFTTVGEHVLAVGDETVTVQVREPAVPTVGSVAAPATVAPGESFTVTGTVRNDAARPAVGSVPVTVDGEQVASRAVELAPGSSTTVRASVRLVERGDHQIAVGNATTTVTVPDDSTPVGTATAVERGETSTQPENSTGDATTSPASGSGASGPGFGVLAALLAVLSVTVARRVRVRR